MSRPHLSGHTPTQPSPIEGEGLWQIIVDLAPSTALAVWFVGDKSGLTAQKRSR